MEMIKYLEAYIEEFEGDSIFEFVQNVKLREVLYFFYSYVFFVYFEEIKNEKSSTKLREIKAHTIIIYLGSVIEALIQYFVKEKITDENLRKKYTDLKEFKDIFKIPTK
jgi:hypothetical protein